MTTPDFERKKLRLFILLIRKTKKTFYPVMERPFPSLKFQYSNFSRISIFGPSAGSGPLADKYESRVTGRPELVEGRVSGFFPHI